MNRTFSVAATLGLAAGFMLASPLMAQPAPPAAPKPLSMILTASNSYVSLAGKVTEDPAENRRRIDQLAEAEGVRSVFRVTGYDPQVSIVHSPSGLVCTNPRVLFIPKAPTPAVFDSSAQSGCISIVQGHQLDQIVLPNAHGLTIGTVMDLLVGQARKEQTGMEELAGRRISGSNGSTRMILGTNGEPRYLHLAVGFARGWVVEVKTRCTYEGAAQCDQIADQSLADTLAMMAKPESQGGLAR